MLDDMKVLGACAREGYGAMESRTRSDGTRYVAFRDDAPDWVRDAVYAAHNVTGDPVLPDDWTFYVVREAFGFIADIAQIDEDADEAGHEFADSVDVYSSALRRWAQDYPLADYFAEEAATDGLAVSGCGPIDGPLMAAQYHARRTLYGVTLAECEKRADTGAGIARAALEATGAFTFDAGADR